MAHSMEEIAEILKKTKFRRKLFGGVDEADVWKKLQRLQAEYEELLAAQQHRAEGQIADRDTVILAQEKRMADWEARQSGGANG